MKSNNEQKSRELSKCCRAIPNNNFGAKKTCDICGKPFEPAEEKEDILMECDEINCGGTCKSTEKSDKKHYCKCGYDKEDQHAMDCPKFKSEKKCEACEINSPIGHKCLCELCGRQDSKNGHNCVMEFSNIPKSDTVEDWEEIDIIVDIFFANESINTKENLISSLKSAIRDLLSAQREKIMEIGENLRKIVDDQGCVCVPREGKCQNCIDEVYNQALKDYQDKIKSNDL